VDESRLIGPIDLAVLPRSNSFIQLSSRLPHSPTKRAQKFI